MGENSIENDSKEFKKWKKDHSITRIKGTNIYEWRHFKYDRKFFLEKFKEDQNNQ